MRDWNYGQFWNIAHKIPCFWYNKNDVEDLKSMNSKANLGCDYAVSGQAEESNSEKSVKLPCDEELIQQGKESWPKEWNGMLPSEAFRQEKYRSRWDSVRK